MTGEEIAVKFNALGGKVMAKSNAKNCGRCIMNIDGADEAR